MLAAVLRTIRSNEIGLVAQRAPPLHTSHIHQPHGTIATTRRFCMPEMMRMLESVALHLDQDDVLPWAMKSICSVLCDLALESVLLCDLAVPWSAC